MKGSILIYIAHSKLSEEHQPCRCVVPGIHVRAKFVRGVNVIEALKRSGPSPGEFFMGAVPAESGAPAYANLSEEVKDAAARAKRMEAIAAEQDLASELESQESAVLLPADYEPLLRGDLISAALEALAEGISRDDSARKFVCGLNKRIKKREAVEQASPTTSAGAVFTN